MTASTRPWRAVPGGASWARGSAWICCVLAGLALAGGLLSPVAVKAALAGEEAGLSAAPAPEEDPRARADALVAAAAERLLSGSGETVPTEIDEALAIYRDLGDRRGEAVCLLLRGLSASLAEEYHRAIADLEASAAALAESGDPFTSWMVFWLLGQLEKNEVRLEAAEGHLRQALDRLDQLERSPESFSLESFKLLGRIFGGPVEVLDQMSPMVRLIAPLLARFAEGATRDTLAGVLLDLGRLQEAEVELERALAVCRLFGGFLDSPIYSHLGDLRRRQWRLAEARAAYEKGLASIAGTFGLLPFAQDSRLEVGVLGRLAEIELLSGRFDAALARNDQALTLVREGGDRRREARVLEERAALLHKGGRFQDAQQTLLAAQEIAAAAADRYRQASILTDLGIYALMRGDYEVSASHLEGALAVYRDLDEPYVEAPVWILLIEAYQMLGSYGAVEELVTRAQELARRASFPEAAAMATALASWNDFISGKRGGLGGLEVFGQLAQLEGGDEYAGLFELLQLVEAFFSAGEAEIARAEDLAGRTLDRESPGPLGPLTRAMARALLAQAAAQRGDYPRAEEEWRRAGEAFAEMGQRDLAGMAFGAIGAMQLKTGRPAEAEESFARAVESLEAVAGGIRVDDLLASFLGGGRRFLFEVPLELLVDLDQPAAAFAYAEKARARALLGQLGNQRLEPARGADRELVARAEALRRSMAEWERWLPFLDDRERERVEDDLRHARAEHRELVVRIKVTNPEYASLVSVQPVDPVAVQAGLDPGTALVSYFVTYAGVHAWVMDRETIRQVKLPVAPQELRDRVEAFVQRVGRFGAGATDRGARPAGSSPQHIADLHGEAEELYRRLFAPLAPHLAAATDKLILVAHGVLHYLPFAALVDPATGRPLVERYTLAYAPSASVLGLLRAKESPVEGRVLVAAMPDPPDPDLAPLAHAAEEAAAVAGLFGAAPVLGAAATESRLYDLAGSVDLLHLAAHGVYDRRSPRFSRIALAPADGHDGNLEVHEVYGGLDLTGVNLVVLSACQTALGERSGGDEIVGLTRAFLYAGSPGVISTLWRIDDLATTRLMVAFYGALRQGRTAAEALRAAQLEILADQRHADPFYWAAFTLTGDPRGRWGGPGGVPSPARPGERPGAPP